MNCPIDNTEMIKTEREGVNIDYCPACRGVWLDRGELNKIIERSSGSADEEKHPGYPDLTAKHSREGKNYKGAGDTFFGNLFDF